MVYFVVLLALVSLISLFMYNGLIRKKNQVEYAFSSIDVMLKKRYDLIPNLVNTVKKYMTFEKETLENIVALRNQAMNEKPEDRKRFAVENQITQALGQISIQFENYPDLKSSANFLQLQASLNEVEEQISAARRAYNASIFDYNNSIEMFPTSLIAGWMGYKRKASFEIDEIERGPVRAFDN